MTARRLTRIFILGFLAGTLWMMVALVASMTMVIHPPPGAWSPLLHMAVGFLAACPGGFLLGLMTEATLGRLADRINEWFMKGRP